MLHKLKLLSKSLLGNEKEKYESRYEILSSLARRSGLRLYNKNLAWLNDEEFLRIWRQFPEMKDYVHERKFNLYNLAKSLQHIEGNIAECGVFNGGSAHLMLSSLPQKKYYGFDSFEGLSEPENIDIPSDSKTFKWQKHDLSVAEERANRCLSMHNDRVKLFKGWIPERFTEVAGEKFCLVHIDVDLYQPTLDSIEFFYPLLANGGMIICDDYGFESCPGAFKAMNEYAHKIGQAVIHLTTGQGIIIKNGI